MSSDVEISTVDASTVDELGFFCYKSKPKSDGYRRKKAWLEERFSEGMRIKIVHETGRSVGFVEYTPGEFAWRAVQAPNYMVIHCVWVVGRAKGKGYGSQLVKACIDDARELKKDGVAMVASSRPWLADKRLLLKHGFESVDEAPPTFELLVHRFGDAKLPEFPKDWETRLSRHGSGVIVFRSDQCPYIEDAANAVLEGARELGLGARVVELGNCEEVQNLSPSPYGVFGIVHDGRLVSYYYLLPKELPQRFSSSSDQPHRRPSAPRG
jgi:L-amino acid N-acyltransferase YncA